MIDVHSANDIVKISTSIAGPYGALSEMILNTGSSNRNDSNQMNLYSSSGQSLPIVSAVTRLICLERPQIGCSSNRRACLTAAVIPETV